MQQEKISILGVEFDNLTLTEAADRGMELMARHKAAYAITPNPEIVMTCRENPTAMSAAKDADLVIPDGIGVIYGAKLLKTPLKEKVPGIDFTTELFKRLAMQNGSVFLFGSKPGVAEAAAKNLSELHPGLRIAGTHNGYFTDDSDIIAQIDSSSPDLLLVCLGAPKQEIWMHNNAGKRNVGLMIGAGGSLDVFAGTVERAPERWQKAGLEWLYRLLKEPKRIGRMMKLPKFLLLVLKIRIFGK